MAYFTKYDIIVNQDHSATPGPWTKDGNILVHLPSGDANLISNAIYIEAALNEPSDEDRRTVIGASRRPRNQNVKIDSPPPRDSI